MRRRCPPVPGTDLGRFLEQAERISGYVRFPIYSLDERPVAILLRTLDRGRVWLNGKFLLETTHPASEGPFEDAIPAKLKAGWNCLLVRVAHETRHHALYLRLSDSTVDLARAGGNSP